MTQPQPYNATIVARRDVHEALCFLHIAPDEKPFAPFSPGQFVSVGRVVEENGSPTLVKRSYSIGSSATERTHVELFVVHVDDGEFTSWLFSQQVGARVWLSPKASGGFTLDGFTRGRDLVLASTGTAIAPCVSMYRTFRHDPPWRRIVIMNGVRYARDFGYRDELDEWSRSDERLLYLPTVTREPAGNAWKGLRGRIDEFLDPVRFHALSRVSLSPEECHVYLCGNPEMIETQEALLSARGFRKHTPGHPGNLHLEKYWTD